MAGTRDEIDDGPVTQQCVRLWRVDMDHIDRIINHLRRNGEGVGPTSVSSAIRYALWYTAQGIRRKLQ